MTLRTAPRLAAPAGLLVPALLALSQLGCHASVGASSPRGGDAESFPTAIDHEACDASSRGAQSLDANGDGKPDVITVVQGGREVCRVVDLNYDGKPDAFLYYDASGALRRKESDFDRDGRIDEVAHYDAGVLRRKDRETNLDGKLDTWDFFQGDKLVSRSRDADGDGKVDQWWHWPDAAKPECALIDADRDGDGRADPGATIDLCADAADAGAPLAPAAPVAQNLDGGVPPPAAPAVASPDAGAPEGDR